MTAVLSEIWRYPVKSLRGRRVAEAAVEPWGLRGDRRWMLVDPDGDALTAREVPGLLLGEAEPTATGLVLTAPGLAPLSVDEPGPEAGERTVRIFGTPAPARGAGEEADAWATRVAGRPAALVWMADPTRRPVDLRFAREADRVSFADGYPLLVTSEASLAALNDELLGSAPHGAEPLDMRRFRPNLVVRGTAAWAEDDWRRLRIDGVDFRAVKGCARCVMTTVDPDTGERGKQPIATLARIRRFDGATWFGVNLVPDLDQLEPGAPVPALRTGAEVEVVELADATVGPLRPSLLG